jgi:hypothetical protein
MIVHRLERGGSYPRAPLVAPIRSGMRRLSAMLNPFD